MARRVEALESDYSVLQAKLSTMVSTTESTKALVSTVREETQYSASDVHQNSARLATTENKVSI